MRDGKAITIAPQNTILTTQDAADLLGISRPTLVRLLEAGDIPFTQPGRHRRVMLSDLIDYQHRSHAACRAVLAEMAREAGEDDTASTVNGFVQTR